MRTKSIRPFFFDEYSDLNRYRAGYAPGSKLRGFIHLLRFQKDREDANEASARPKGKAAEPGDGQRRDLVLAAKDSERLIVLQFKPGSTELESPLSSGTEVRIDHQAKEPDDKFRVFVSGLNRTNVSCRILLMSAATLNRLCESVSDEVAQPIAPKQYESFLKRILSDDSLKQNDTLVRRLATVADIDAEVDEDGFVAACAKIPKGVARLPKDTCVVVVLDEPRHESK